LNEEGLLSLEFSLHDGDGAFSLDETVVTVGVTFLKLVDLFTLLGKELLEGVNQLKVRGWGHVVVSLKLCLEFAGRHLSILMEGLHHLDTRLKSAFFHLDIAQEADSDGLQGILRPLREPINSGTIDQGWEVFHSVSE